MPEISYSKKDLERYKKFQKIVETETELREVNCVLKRHVMRLVKIAFWQAGFNKADWNLFRTELNKVL